ncbi:MAG: class I SAM-dependent DNA methyltransferase [Bacteroidota bacterium]|nr:class I SAM-dependent DNA methyltransferase [Bacteroidota bacterium]
MSNSVNISSEASLVWQSANEILRDVFKRSEYPDIILPMVLIRRIECVLTETSERIQKQIEKKIAKLPPKERKKVFEAQVLNALKFYNTSGLTLKKIIGGSERSLKSSFTSYLNGYTDNIQKIIKASGIRTHIDKLHTKRALYPLLKQYSELDFTLTKVDNIKMGYIFEELVRRFSEQNNEEAGEHYTPREVIQLMVHLLNIDEDKIKNGELISVYDCACGTGGMITTTKDVILNEVNPRANVRLYGQEVNDKTWAICQADMLLKGEPTGYIANGDTLTDDSFPAEKFNYMLTNPPYGKSWKTIQDKVLKNNNGRFDAGQPRSSDGQLLFLQHLISKMRPKENGGSAIAIVLNGSPLFSGDAGSGESEIRKWVIENDWLEAIVALPNDLFYNTGISTFIWVVRNNKKTTRQGKVQLINATSFFKKEKKSLGNKRNFITDEQIVDIVKLHKDFTEGDFSKIFSNEEFAYRKVFLDLEERDDDGNPVYKEKEFTLPLKTIKEIISINPKDEERFNKLISNEPADEKDDHSYPLIGGSEFVKTIKTPDTAVTIKKVVTGKKVKLTATIQVPVIVKDTESISWNKNMEEFLSKEVEKPWIITETLKGYEIPFTQIFYKFQPLPELDTVTNELEQLEMTNQLLLAELKK